MPSTITTPEVSQLLDILYADAATNDPLVREAAHASGELNEVGFYKGMSKAYMAVPADFGRMLYNLARCTGSSLLSQ